MTKKNYSDMNKEEYIAAMMEDLPDLTREGAERLYDISRPMIGEQKKRDADKKERESRKVKDLPALTGMNVRFCRSRPPKSIKARVSRRGQWMLPGTKRADDIGKGWNVPATGGYAGGWETGTALAYAFLKQAKAEKGGMSAGHTFQWILESAFKATDPLGGIDKVLGRMVFDMPDANCSMRGQLCGFIQTIGNWAASAAVMLTGEPHQLSYEQIVGLANRGLAYSQADHDAEMMPIWEAEEEADKAERRAATTAKRRQLREARKAAALVAPPTEYVAPERLAA